MSDHAKAKKKQSKHGPAPEGKGPKPGMAGRGRSRADSAPQRSSVLSAPITELEFQAGPSGAVTKTVEVVSGGSGLVTAIALAPLNASKAAGRFEVRSPKGWISATQGDKIRIEVAFIPGAGGSGAARASLQVVPTFGDPLVIALSGARAKSGTSEPKSKPRRVPANEKAVLRPSMKRLEFSPGVTLKANASVDVRVEGGPGLLAMSTTDPRFRITHPNGSIRVKPGSTVRVELEFVAGTDGGTPAQGRLELQPSFGPPTSIALVGHNLARKPVPYNDLPRERRAAEESARIPNFTYSIKKAERRNPARTSVPLSNVVYVRDRVELDLELSGGAGPLALRSEAARGFSISRQAGSSVTLRAEVPGRYDVRFSRGRSHYKGPPLRLEIAEEVERPRIALLDPAGRTQESRPESTTAGVKRKESHSEVKPDEPAGFLASDSRDALERETGDRINTAVERFGNATALVQGEISSKLSVERAFWRALFELAFGFGVGRVAGLAASGIVELSDFARSKVGDAAAEVLGKSNLVKGPLTVATKHAVRVGVNAYTPGPKALFMHLRDLAHQAAQDFRGMIDTLTDGELVAAYELWDVKNCTEADYAAAIRVIVSRWRSQVDRIGTEQTTADRSLGTARVVWIADGRIRRLALAIHVQAGQSRGADIEREEHGNSRATSQGEIIRRRAESRGRREGSQTISERWIFETWIDPDMQQMALKGGGAFPVLDANRFANRHAFDVD